MQHALRVQERQHGDVCIAVLSEVHLDHAASLSNLRALFQGYHDADFVPLAIVLCGNFCGTRGADDAAHLARYEEGFAALAEILAATYPAPAIFLGYLVTLPHMPRPSPYGILFGEGRLLDVDKRDLDRWCQYLGFRGLERVAYARVSRYTVTDTELQTFKLRVPLTPLPGDRDVLPRKLPYAERPVAAWTYPGSLIRPHARLNETHRYGPEPYPTYFAPP